MSKVVISEMTDQIAYVLEYEDPSFEGDTEQDPKKTKMDNLRRRFIVAMRKELLAVQEERVGKHIFVKISCPKDRLIDEAENMRIELPLLGLVLQNPEEEEAMIERRMKRIFNSGEKRKAQASAPFQRSCMDLFVDKDNPSAPIFWSSIKVLVVYNILTNINISRNSENGELPEKIGLSYLLMIRAFNDGFVLHDPSVTEPITMSENRRPSRLQEEPLEPELDLRQILGRRWGGICCRQQPIREVRDYFGEKIAFYFSWISLLVSSLWLPALLGLIIFIFGLCRRLDRQHKGVLYYIEVIKNSSDNELTPGFAAIICLWGTIFMEVWKRRQISLAHEWHVSNFDFVEPDRPQFYGTKSQLNPFTKTFFQHYPVQKRILKYFASLSVLLLMVMLVFISVTSVILYRVYMTISVCEKGDGLCGLLHGTILATLLNTLSIMVLGRVYEHIAVKLTEWENHQTLSEHNDALIIKLYAFQFANTYSSLFYTAFFRRDFGVGILGTDKKYTDNCGHEENSNCMSLLSFQLLVLMIVKPFPKFVRDVIWPWMKKAFEHCRLNDIEDFTTGGGVTKQHYLLRENLKPSAEDFRLGEFTEKMIQYGYLMLFAASFPLAPALAVIFNIIDLRIDTKRLLWWNRRPIPYRDNDIGIWFHIINFINVCGVISNAFLIAFNSELGRDQPLMIKFAIVIGFEHFIFFMKFALSLIIPDVPTWVRNSQRKERYLLSHLMTKCCPDNPPKRQIPPILVENGHGSLNNGDEVITMPKSRWSYG